MNSAALHWESRIFNHEVFCSIQEWLLCEHTKKRKDIHEETAKGAVHLYGICIEDDMDYAILLNEMVHHRPLTFCK